MRFSCAIGGLVAWWILAGTVAAEQGQQGPASPDGGAAEARQVPSAEQPPAWAQQLIQRLERLERQLASSPTKGGEKAGQGEQKTQRQEELPQWAQELILRVDRLEDRVKRLAAQTDEALRGLHSLARREGDHYYPQLLGKMQDAKFRDEVQRVVQGTLVVNNLTGVTQSFYVNGGLWQVPPGRWELQVPFGVVYARLPWEPDSKRWNSWRLKNGRQELYLEIRY